MQGLELSLEVLDKMFMFDSFQNGSIKLINIIEIDPQWFLMPHNDLKVHIVNIRCNML